MDLGDVRAVCVAAALGQEESSSVTSHFNGKIEEPHIHRTLGAGCDYRGETVLRWDLSTEKFKCGRDTQGVMIDWLDLGIGRLGAKDFNARLVNTPTLGVKGRRWSGREQCWRHAPREYAAVHFHADDVGDCEWEESFSFTVPETLPSGAYAMRLCAVDGGDECDTIPFFVCPRKELPRQVMDLSVRARVRAKVS